MSPAPPGRNAATARECSFSGSVILLTRLGLPCRVASPPRSRASRGGGETASRRSGEARRVPQEGGGSVGEPWVPPRLKNAYAAERPVADAGDADQAVAGLEPPDAGVLRDAAVVAEHEVEAGGDLLPGEVGRRLAVGVGLVQPHRVLARILHPDVAALRPHRLARQADDPLHERRAREALSQVELG